MCAVRLIRRRPAARKESGIYLTERRELLLAVPAITTGDLERDDDAVADVEIFDAFALFRYNAHELVAENVAILESEDFSVVKVKVGTADRGAGDVQYDIVLRSTIRTSYRTRE